MLLFTFVCPKYHAATASSSDRQNPCEKSFQLIHHQDRIGGQRASGQMLVGETATLPSLAEMLSSGTQSSSVSNFVWPLRRIV